MFFLDCLQTFFLSLSWKIFFITCPNIKLIIACNFNDCRLLRYLRIWCNTTLILKLFGHFFGRRRLDFIYIWAHTFYRPRPFSSFFCCQSKMVFCYQNCSDLLWEKTCSSDWEKILKFEAEAREFAKNLRSLE